MRNLSLMLLLCLSATLAQASHSLGGLDMCALYPQVMPPGMQVDQLPQAESQGAALLKTYCNQCHELPGPGRHTADEWPAVFERMVTLMDVGNRFSGLLGHIKTPGALQQQQLLDYLQSNSLRAMATKPAGVGAAAFTRYCGDCHALPDPAQHSASEWTEVLKRMQRNMQVMQYDAPSADNLVQIQLFLQTAQGVHQGTASDDLHAVISQRVSPTGHYLQSSLALGPFVLLVSIGLLRWYRRQQRQHNRGAR